MVEHDSVGVAPLGANVALAPVLAVVSEDDARAVLVVATVALLALAACAHHAPHARRVTECKVALRVLSHLCDHAHDLVPAHACMQSWKLVTA